jgi:hypothetical protein
VENQAIDRVHRLGQSRTVTVKRLVVEDTVEEVRALALQQYLFGVITRPCRLCGGERVDGRWNAFVLSQNAVVLACQWSCLVYALVHTCTWDMYMRESARTSLYVVKRRATLAARRVKPRVRG